MVLPVTTLEHLFGARAAAIEPDVIAPTLAAELRRSLAGGLSRYALLDRGSYEVTTLPVKGTGDLLSIAFDLAVRVGAAQTGRTLRVDEARLLRLVPGDYLLAHHDRLHDDAPVEVTLDLSPAPVPGAEIHYRRRGQVFFRVPCAPGSVVVVERGPTVTCNHAYVSRLHPGAEVVRLVTLLRDVEK